MIGTPDAPLSVQLPLIAFLSCIVVCAMLIALLCWLNTAPKQTIDKSVKKRASNPKHQQGHPLAYWRKAVSIVTERHLAGELTRHEAFVALAGIARSYATSRTGEQYHALTLQDIAQSHDQCNTSGIVLLRQSIAGLYPAEFANDQHAHSQHISVEDASQWLMTLIERWQ